MGSSPVSGAVGPLARAGVVGRVTPFLVTAAGGVLILAVSGDARPWALLLAGALTAGLALVAIAVPWRRLPLGAQCVVPLSFFLVIFILRAASAGNGSGIGSLSLLPVCWVAMYGGRVALALALAGTGAVYYAPALVLGGADFPLSDAGRGTMLVLVAALVGISFHRSARALDAQRTVASTSAAQLTAVANVMHSLQAGDDARAVICRGACEVSGAAVGQLLEPRDSELVMTGCVGAEVPAQVFALGDGTPAVRSFSTGRRVLVDGGAYERSPAGSAPGASGRGGALYEPVVRGGRVVAVLVVTWPEPPPSIEDAISGVALMAVEAGIAMERADMVLQLDRMARTDELTGVANRRAWAELLPAELSRSHRTGPVCVALLDMDHFKAYNDLHGHPAGDRVLRDSAGCWARQLRGTDTLARYGGEEFAVVLPQCDLADAELVLDKVRRATPHGQSVSIGLARWDGRETAEELLARADAAMYSAKSAGRNRIGTAA